MPYTKTTWVDGSAPAIDAANLNNIETGIADAPYGPDASSNQVPIWNGSAWTYGQVANAQVSASAAIAYSKLNLATSIVNADVSASAAIAYSKLALSNSIVNADIASAAAIALSKLAGYPSDGTKFAAGDGTWKAASSTTYRKTTTKAVNNTVTETDLLNSEITIGAGVLGTTGVLRLVAYGDWLQNTGGTIATPRLKLKLGATTIFDTNSIAGGWLTHANRGTWDLEAKIANAGAANAQIAEIHGTVGSLSGGAQFSAFNTAFTTGTGINIAPSSLIWLLQGTNSGLAVDTTAAQALTLTVTLPSASASEEWKLFGALVEIV